MSKGMAEQQLVAPMHKAGDVFGPKPRMISNRPVLDFWIKGGGRLNLPTFIFMWQALLSRLAHFSRVTLHVLRLPRK